MNVTKEKIPVTGADGFICSHLCESLVRADADVRALVRYNSVESHGLLEALPPDVYNRIEVVSGDIRDSVSVARAPSGCRVVFHL